MTPDQINERSVEVPWLLARLVALMPHALLDVGHADASYTADLLPLAVEVTLQDCRPFTPAVGGVHIYIGPSFPASWAGKFDVVSCLSVLDHIGLVAYGQQADDTALARFVASLSRVLAPGGRLLLTVPVGRDHLTTTSGHGQRVFSPLALADLFPDALWTTIDATYYRLIGGQYVPVTASEVDDAGYLGVRAEAVACLTLQSELHALADAISTAIVSNVADEGVEL